MISLSPNSARRFSALADKSAWLLIAPALLALFLIDTPMALTLTQWLVFIPVIAGISIIVSRLIFPQVYLGKLIEKAEQDNLAAGIVAGSLIVFVGILVLSLIMWAKA